MLALWKPDMKPFWWLLSIDINPRHSESVKVSFHFSSLRHSLLLLLIDKVFRYTRSCVNVIIRTVNRTKKKVVFKLQQGRLTTFFRLRFFIFVCSSFKRNSIKLRVSFLVRIVLLTTNDYAWAKIVFRSLTRTNLVLLNDSSNSLARGSRVRYAWTFQDDLFVLRFKPLWKCQQSVDCIRTVSLIIHSPRSFKSQLAWKKFNETTSMFADCERVSLSFATPTNFLSMFSWSTFSISFNNSSRFQFCNQTKNNKKNLRFRWMFLSLRLPVKS